MVDPKRISKWQIALVIPWGRQIIVLIWWFFICRLRNYPIILTELYITNPQYLGHLVMISPTHRNFQGLRIEVERPWPWLFLNVVKALGTSPKSSRLCLASLPLLGNKPHNGAGHAAQVKSRWSNNIPLSTCVEITITMTISGFLDTLKKIERRTLRLWYHYVRLKCCQIEFCIIFLVAINWYSHGTLIRND